MSSSSRTMPQDPIGDSINNRPPYDDSDLDSILKYAAKLTGRTLNEILGEESGFIGGKRTKGYFGQLIESGYFFIDNNSLPLPDFQKVGMELKVSPMKETRDGLVSKERLDRKSVV